MELVQLSLVQSQQCERALIWVVSRASVHTIRLCAL